MKSLKQTAAKLDLYKKEDIPERYRSNDEYYQHRIDFGTERGQIPEFLSNLKGYETGLFYECEEQTNNTTNEYYLGDNSYVLLKKMESEVPLIVSKNWKDKKYHFHPVHRLMHKFHNIDHYLKATALKDLTEPNRIGVFTEKKVEDWVKYNDQKIKILDDLLHEVTDKNTHLEKQISDFIESVPGCKVSRYQDQTSVTTSLFTINFTFYKASNHLNTKFEFNGKIADITKIEGKLLSERKISATADYKETGNLTFLSNAE